MSTSISRSRSGAVERLSVRDRRDGPPGPGLMQSGPYWRISRWTIWRFRLRDGFVTATAGTDPPWPPLLKGGALRNIRGGKSPLLILQVFNRPPRPPLLNSEKLCATFAAGNLRSLFCKFSPGHPGPLSQGGKGDPSGFVFVAVRDGCAHSPLRVVEQCLEVFSAPDWREVVVVLELVDVIESEFDGLAEGRQGGGRRTWIAWLELGPECERAC